MQRGLSARAYMAIYAYMQGIYAYMEPGKHIYRPYIYVFHVYMCVFVQVACCIYANECNLMQMYALLHINAPPNEESRPRLCAAKLTQILGTKVDQALSQWLD